MRQAELNKIPINPSKNYEWKMPHHCQFKMKLEETEDGIIKTSDKSKGFPGEYHWLDHNANNDSITLHPKGKH